ncbi:MAG: hypothetical protein J7M19_01545 [Planctomycetes bacterium]|nr:hypothetical protein [Planctomycetota bacterium]
MPDRPADAPRHRGVLVALAVLAGLAGLAAFYLHSGASEALAAAAKAQDRLAEDRALAREYTLLAPQALVISADLSEAQSSEFIQKTLEANRITPGQVEYGDPEKGDGKYDRVTITIPFKAAGLSSVLGFLRATRSTRPQLSLLGADIEKKGPDEWDGSLTYGALIPAISRN